MRLTDSKRAAIALTTAVCAAPAAAQIGSAPILDLDQAVYEPGQTIALDVQGTPGDLTFLLINSTADQPFVPNLGTLGVALTGLSIVPVGAIPQDGGLLLTCEIDCDSPLLEVPCILQAVSIDPVAAAFRPPSNTEVLSFAGGDCGVCVDPAETDEFAKFGGGHALHLPGIGGDFVFVAGGDFIERADGTALLIGEVARKSNPDQRFEVDVLLTGRISPGEVAYPPLDSPKLELEDEAYVTGGGAVNPDGWHYYESTQGLLTGRGDFEGACVSLSRKGPAFQVGYGASGKNIQYGGSGWLNVSVLCQPTDGEPLEPKGNGDFNLDIDRDCADCATEAGNHSLALKALGQDFVFVDGGDFIEHADGTATLSGVVEDVQIPSRRWTVDVTLSERVNPGAASFPPQNSPKLELGSSAYVENGGSIDTDRWHYYLSTEGTLTGLDDNDGGLVSLTRNGPAFQVGFGASGKHTEYGGSGWLTAVVLAQPTSGPNYPDGELKGDFNLDLDAECPDDN